MTDQLVEKLRKNRDLSDSELKELIDLHEEGNRETLETVFRGLTMAENKA